MKGFNQQIRDENIKPISLMGAEPVDARVGSEAATPPGFTLPPPLNLELAMAT